MTYKALVFDMDGTLLDTLEDLADSTNAALNQHGFDSEPTDAYRYHVGSGARNLVIRALPEDKRDDATVDAVLATYKAHYANNWANKTKLYAGLNEFLNQLAQHDIALAILTNKPQNFANQCVDHFLSNWKWQAVQGQVEGIAIKPSAEISNKVLEQLNIEPSEVLYIGDTNVDMQTAKNAGFTSVGVTWGFRSEAELRESGAQHIVHTPEEILALVK